MKDIINKGIQLFKNKEYIESLKVFHKLYELNPSNLQILVFYSLNLMFNNNFELALKILDEIEKKDPQIPETYFNKALCLTHLKNYQLSIEYYLKAINFKNDYHQAYLNLGVLYKNLGQPESAIEIYKKALDNIVNKDEIYINLSEIYKSTGNILESKKYAIEALKISPQNALALNNLGIALIDENKLSDSVEVLERAVKINPSLALIYNNLGIAYEYSSDYTSALKNYDKATKVDSNFHDAYFNMGQIYLTLQEFKKGWVNYEHRWGKTDKRPTRINFNKPIWNPQLGFKRILIWGEQGMGEQILFSAILKNIITKFESIVLMLDDRLCQLYKESFPHLIVVGLNQTVDNFEFDYHLPICSLGLFFRNSLQEFTPDKIISLTEKSEIANTFKNKKLRCAISWKSTNPHTGQARSVMLNDLKDILKLKNIEFYNIQYTNEDDEVNQFYQDHGVLINKVANLDTYNDIYSLTHFINTCDFVITISNTNAHLSAAIGKPTFLLLTKERGKFWYWENEINGNNIWYPSIKKFTQPNPGDWKTPIEDLKLHIAKEYEILNLE